MSDIKLDLRVERRLKRRSKANRCNSKNPYRYEHIVIDLEEEKDDQDKETIGVVEPEICKQSDRYSGGFDSVEQYEDSEYKKFLQNLKQHGNSYTLSVSCGNGETKEVRYDIDDWIPEAPGANEALVANRQSREKRTSSSDEKEGLRASTFQARNDKKEGSETSGGEPIPRQSDSSAAREASVENGHHDWRNDEEYVSFLDSGLGEHDDHCQEDLDDDTEKVYENSVNPFDYRTRGKSDPSPSSVGNGFVGREHNQGTSAREGLVRDCLVENERHEWSDDEEYARFLDSGLLGEHDQTGRQSNPSPSSNGNRSVGQRGNDQGNDVNDEDNENHEDFIDLDDSQDSEPDDATEDTSESDDVGKDYMEYLDRLEMEDEDTFDDESEESEGSDVAVLEKGSQMDEDSTPCVPTRPSNARNRQGSEGVDVGEDCTVYLDEREESDTDSDVVVIEEGSRMDVDFTPFVPAHSAYVINVETYCPIKDSNASRAQFKQDLLGILKKPYDSIEHQQLRKEVEVRKPVLVDRNLRSTLKTYQSKDKMGKSYLDQHGDFAILLDIAKTDNHKSLNLLRGFFYWLKNVSRNGAFEPWKDPSILEVLPQK